ARRRLRGALHRAAAQPAAAILPRRRRQRLRARADLAGPAPAEVVAAGGAEAAAGTRVAATCHARQARRIRVLLLPVATLIACTPFGTKGARAAGTRGMTRQAVPVAERHPPDAAHRPPSFGR